MVNKALCIGFAYNGTRYQLNGPLNDARNMMILFKKLGFDTQLYTDQLNRQNAYKQNLINRLNTFMSNLNDSDTGIITISSHGSLIYDTDMDEIPGEDGKQFDQGVVCRAGDGDPMGYDLLIDDKLCELITSNLKNKKNVKLLFIVDCCYSGSICDLQYKLKDSRYIPVGSKIINGVNHVALISGSTEHQYSYETRINGNIQGILSNAIIKSINTLTPTNQMINIRNLYDVLLKDKYFDSVLFPQHPVLSSNITTDLVFSINLSTIQNNIKPVRFTRRREILEYIC